MKGNNYIKSPVAMLKKMKNPSISLIATTITPPAMAGSRFSLCNTIGISVPLIDEKIILNSIDREKTILIFKL